MGPVAVGKTAITMRYCSEQFDENYDPTISDTWELTKQIDGTAIKLTIHDTAGMEYFEDLRETWCSGKDIVLLVFDITKSDTIDKLDKFLETVETIDKKQKTICM
eukprot:UN30840